MYSQTEIIPVELSDGTMIKIEATPVGEQDVGSIQGHALKQATSAIRSITHEVAGTLQDLRNESRPDKVSIKLGLEIAIEGGQLTALIVKGASKANFEITMEWSGRAEKVDS